MTTNAEIAKDTVLRIENIGSPQSMIKVNGLVSIAPSRTNLLAETTDYDSDHMEHISSGVKDGAFQAVYNFIETDSGQAELDTALGDGLARNFRYEYNSLSTPAIYQFSAIVETIAEAPALKGVIQKTATLKVTSTFAEV